MYLAMSEDSREHFLVDEAKEGRIIIHAEYRCHAQTSSAAVRKALAEFPETYKHGNDWKLGQGPIYIEVERTHKTEVIAWQKEKGNKILM